MCDGFEWWEWEYLRQQARKKEPQTEELKKPEQTAVPGKPEEAQRQEPEPVPA